jgi:hypothetical protein
MFTVLYELNHYNGTLEGICRDDYDKCYYYCFTEHTDIHSNEPRTYYLYELNGLDGQPLTWQIMVEGEVLR